MFNFFILNRESIVGWKLKLNLIITRITQTFLCVFPFHQELHCWRDIKMLHSFCRCLTMKIVGILQNWNKIPGIELKLLNRWKNCIYKNVYCSITAFYVYNRTVKATGKVFLHTRKIGYCCWYILCIEKSFVTYMFVLFVRFKVHKLKKLIKTWYGINK